MSWIRVRIKIFVGNRILNKCMRIRNTGRFVYEITVCSKYSHIIAIMRSWIPRIGINFWMQIQLRVVGEELFTIFRKQTIFNKKDQREDEKSCICFDKMY
jgi:hypothetical protein